MTTQFDFHLLGAEAPAGELDADTLLALVGSLKEVATKIARVETDADERGRIPKRTGQVSRLTIGLGKGSTVVHMHRSGVIGGLDFSVPEEQAFDERFSTLVRSLADESRPEWVSDSLATATRNLATLCGLRLQRSNFQPMAARCASSRRLKSICRYGEPFSR